ncbi:glutaminyl-tRNA synthase (glutamine-hydrolyzing) subunit B [Candidatus Kaiserbacteria bacterium RIFCSPHIGHO2_01_FULL_56_24]|uniref:Aspartyl/glutamyl-tRNA(Asn/Gln) amidotransferase subunit B n=1 Tax=Candidatus Kaiserbacteria bacterium RIFCSPHIGHO2_01_FULL_56_24 TaxID=1798487 RepID=A0A1F6DHC1_9BACT|nr:MAG: glutaminyl-tRNA synthase (glutamine-hydrolyzing) subunit B [Candidatus Kaiserbacteria bacterium RIFCSPHIGHO2_01_FULL_56_24]
MAYNATIGLEVHAELKTRTKMFCASKNDAHEARPNVNICPVCLAHPGTLPVINKEAVRHVLRVGLALGAKLADYTEFDRKNYFYPDLPKGYQISQYEYPLVSGGELCGIAITRVHLEEDTASSIHDDETGATLIDFNRSGMPLMELVTEPVIHTAEEAGRFGRELQLLLRYLEASDADMEQGQMRLEANISVSESDTLGTKVEVKNINSFRAMERAVAYEIERQSELLSRGERVVQETRGWDDAKQQTFSQRVKEVAADYRYFPDPDLPSLKLSEIADFAPAILQDALPELPDTRRERYAKQGIKTDDAEQFVSYPLLGAYFDTVSQSQSSDLAFIQRSANYIANDLVSIIREMDSRDTDFKGNMPISADRFAKIMSLIGEGKISSRVAKDLLRAVIEEDKEPEIIAKERGLFSAAATDVTAVIDTILAEHASVVADYKGGKEAALQFLIGQGMRTLKGAVDPAQLRASIIERIAV